MPYDPAMVQPMKDEVTRLGAQSLTTPAEVETALGAKKGTVLVFVNSVCGCAAGMARPALRMALGHKVKPDRVVTVFAGQDLEAVARARAYFTGMPPSSPSFGLLKDGALVHMVHRGDIEGRPADQVAANLASAFDRFCAKPA